MSNIHIKKAGSLGYIPEFDSLRAIAVFAVLVSHYRGGFLDVIEASIPIGLFGVHLFFVLSGFLITSILIDAQSSLDSGNALGPVMKSFFARRFLRILPVYYLLLILEFFWGDETFRQVMIWHAAYLSNTISAVFSDPMAGGHLLHASSAHLWSLSVEAQFYLIWPFLILLLKRRSAVMATVLLIALALLSRAFFFMLGYHLDVGYLISSTDTLAAGALLAMWKQGWLPWLSRSMISKATFSAAAVFAACVSMSVQNLWYRPSVIIFPLAESILFAWLLLALLEGKMSAFASVLRTKWLIYLGRISYGIYLYHAFVWDTVSDHIIDLTSTYPLVQSAIATLATIAVASASWWFIEKPILRVRPKYEAQ